MCIGFARESTLKDSQEEGPKHKAVVRTERPQGARGQRWQLHWGQGRLLFLCLHRLCVVAGGSPTEVVSTPS